MALPRRQPLGRLSFRAALCGVLALCASGLVGCQTTGGTSAPAVMRGQEEDPTRIEISPQTAPKKKLFDSLMFWDRIKLFKSDAPPPPSETMIFGSEGPKVLETPEEGTIQAELAGAREMFRQGKYSQAEALYARMADPSRYPPATVEEARFYEAECLRLQLDYPKAADTYTDVLKKFPHSVYRDQCLQHMYDIANYWLDDTRKQMSEQKEKVKGERWWVAPRFISFEKTKPFMDREGRAIEKLEQVHYNDVTGPLAPKALFLIGSVKFFNENYRDADYYFSQLYERHSKSDLAPKAVELAIISKHLSTGGSDYDGRKSAEARKLVQAALRSYPELAQKRDFLMQQLVNINVQQAEKDFKMAEFYAGKGKPGSAYFMYEMVRRRYPGTRYAQLSTEKILELRAQGQAEVPLPPETETPRATPDGAPQPELAPRPRPVGPASPAQPEIAPPPRPVR